MRGRAQRARSWCTDGDRRHPVSFATGCFVDQHVERQFQRWRFAAQVLPTQRAEAKRGGGVGGAFRAALRYLSSRNRWVFLMLEATTLAEVIMQVGYLLEWRLSGCSTPAWVGAVANACTFAVVLACCFVTPFRSTPARLFAVQLFCTLLISAPQITLTVLRPLLWRHCTGSEVFMLMAIHDTFCCYYLCVVMAFTMLQTYVMCTILMLVCMAPALVLWDTVIVWERLYTFLTVLSTNLMFIWIAVLREYRIRRDFCILLQEEQRRQRLAKEKKHQDRLLHTLLPREVAEHVLQEKAAGTKDGIFAETYVNCTVAFASIDGLHESDLNNLMEVLGNLFRIFDEIFDSFQITKIKTIASSVMFACGAPSVVPASARNVVSAAVQMRRFTASFRDKTGIPVSIRVGVANGTVVGGLLGLWKPQFDLWGDVVNIAARLNQIQNPGQGAIFVEPGVHELLGSKFIGSKQNLCLKGKGEMVVWSVTDHDDAAASSVPDLLSETLDCVTATENTFITKWLTQTYERPADDQDSSGEGYAGFLQDMEKEESQALARLCDIRPPKELAARHYPSLTFQDPDMELRFAEEMASSHQQLARVSFALMLLASSIAVALGITLSWLYGTCGPSDARSLAKLALVVPWIACLALSTTKLFKNAHGFQAVQICGGFLYGLADVIIYWSGAQKLAVPLGIATCFLYTHMMSHILFHSAFSVSLVVYAAGCGMMAYVYRDHWWLSLFYTTFFFCIVALSHINLESRLRQQFALGVFVQHGQEVLRKEKQFTRSLIVSMVPEPVLVRLAKHKYVADYVEQATCLAFDIVGFTPLCATLPPQAVIVILATLFSLIDAVAERHGCERLKTLGDSYIAVCNVMIPNDNHAEVALNTALDVLAVLDHVNKVAWRYPSIPWPEDLRVRAGCHTGPMLAGAIQMKNPIYDVWGPTLAVAEGMQESGASNKVHCTVDTFVNLRAHHPITETDFVVAPGPPFSQTSGGILETFLISGGLSAAARSDALYRTAERVLRDVNSRFTVRSRHTSGHAVL
eukprot:TRINITY_DN3311_c0_g1_i4.p1 TRINITY_DN3311_c0_g1~~TRINITY_DN3311_c0_g1_i4.p1  ORF type:complete len:1031 (+),score=219.63 TRINITY_DN3311_c0_g1_i4:38-3130(+)